MSTDAAQRVTAAYSGVKQTYEPPEEFRRRAHISSMAEYEERYRRSVEEPEAFWKEQAERITWFEPFRRVKHVSFDPGSFRIGWYLGGKLNASYNCLDRHLEERGDKTAFIFEPDDPNEDAVHISYRELYERVCRFANVLKKHGVEKGNRVTIYLPMIPEAAVAMLACARIGAIHSVVFAGFSPEALSERIRDCESDVLITADEGLRGGTAVPLKQNADKALEECPDIRLVLVVQRTGSEISWNEERDRWYHEEVETVDSECEPEIMDAEDPLFILYTSGSTGKPKGVVHTTGGYLVFTSLTHELVFDIHDDDVYWCTADVGWITGHSYIVYGPLVNGATQVIFEGKPTYPDPSRLWQVVDRHGVTVLYTAPTAIRALMREGDDYVTRTDRSSLRVLGSVGEPINPEAWRWYYEVVGNGRCPVVDTWWQTETGGIMITPLPGATTAKPGSATLPFFGIQPALVTRDGEMVKEAGQGRLVIKESWPGQARTVYRDHGRFISTYFIQHKGCYFTGDGARRDEDGYYWITGRVDDVLIVSGHRIGTAEVESALVQHEKVAEAAVVGFPHEVKGQGIYAYVTLTAESSPTEELRRELIQHVSDTLGPIAKPDQIQFAEALPKTRSGKIMRRILRKIAAGDHEDLGDTSTLADQSVVEALVSKRE